MDVILVQLLQAGSVILQEILQLVQIHVEIMQEMELRNVTMEMLLIMTDVQVLVLKKRQMDGHALNHSI